MARFTKPLTEATDERAAIALAAGLTSLALDDAIDILHAVTIAANPRDAANRAGFLLLAWDWLADGGRL